MTSRRVLRAPFPSYALFACMSHAQFAGCLPVRFVALFVDQRRTLRAVTRASMHFSWNAGRCSARWSRFDTSSRFSSRSSSLSSFLWWMPMPRGIGPFADSQTCRARSTHVFGSATFTKARLSPPRLCRVRIRTVPVGRWLCGSIGSPSINYGCDNRGRSGPGPCRYPTRVNYDWGDGVTATSSPAPVLQ